MSCISKLFTLVLWNISKLTMNFLKRRKILRSINSLDLVPVRLFSHDESDGKVVIKVPKFTSRWIHSLFPVTKDLFYKIRLDESGSSVWRNINGEMDILGISRKLNSGSGQDEPSRKDFEKRLVKFISLLYDQKYIGFRQLSDS